MRRGAILIWAAFTLTSSSINAVRPYLGLYTLRLGGTAVDVGMVYAAASLAMLLLRVPLGRLLDWARNKMFFVIIGDILVMIGLTAYLLAISPPMLVAGSIIRGIGFAAYHIAILAAIVSLRRAEFGVVMTGAPIGQSIGPGIGSAIFSVLGFKGVFAIALTLVATSIACTSILAFRRYDGVRHSTRRELGYDGFTWNKRMIPALYGRAAASFVIGMVYSVVPLYMVSSVGVGEAEVGLFFLVAALMNLVGRPLAAEKLYYTDRPLATSLGLALIAASPPVMLAGSYEALWMAMLLYGTGLGIFIPLSFLYVNDAFPPERRGMGMGIMTLMIDAGIASGNVVSTIVYNSLGALPTFTLSSIIVVSGIAALLATRP